MGNNIITHIIRSIFVILLQVLIFRQIQFGDSFLRYTHVLLYPLIILLLPLKVSRNALILIGFSIGIILDIFYNSIGIHAATAVFTAFLRPYILQLIEPRGGYNVNISPTRFHLGFPWFVQYASILVLIHCFIYFSVEAFSFVYFKEIVFSTILSFIFSMTFILLYQFIVNPK